MSNAKAFFAKLPLSSMTTGHLEDYKSWRRSREIKEVTIRHDLHALSLLFQYGKGHRWCRGNLIEEIDIPSDAESNRTRVLSVVEEHRFFATIDGMIAQAKNHAKRLLALKDIRDLSTLILNQG